MNSKQSSTSHGLLTHLGEMVLVDQFTVCVEKITEGQNSEVFVYLYARQCTFAISSKEKSSNNHAEQATTGPLCLYVAVLNKNSLVAQPSSAVDSPNLLFTVQALVHSEIEAFKGNSTELEEESGASNTKSIQPSVRIALEFSTQGVKWYSYVSNGSLYSLTHKNSPFPTLSVLETEPCIMVEEGMSLKIIQDQLPDQSLPVLDVSVLMSKLFLPRLKFESSLQILTDRYIVWCN